MTVLPVISRELRASARQPFTYYVRVLGAMACWLAGALFGLNSASSPLGRRVLFSSLHGTLFVAIWLLVPMLTADCISRERREGPGPAVPDAAEGRRHRERQGRGARVAGRDPGARGATDPDRVVLAGRGESGEAGFGCDQCRCHVPGPGGGAAGIDVEQVLASRAPVGG